MTTPAAEAEQILNLDRAWHEIELAIASLGDCIRSQTSGYGAQHRFEGYKAALALVAESYINQVHFDRERPEVLPTLGWAFNYGAPNPDFAYKVVHLEPGASYRVWGQRGDAELIDAQQMSGWFGQSKEKMSAATVKNQLFDAQNIRLDADGHFDFVLSPTVQPGDWWKLEEGITTLLIRDYFTDYATQSRPSLFHVDKLDSDVSSPMKFSPEQSANALECYARALKELQFTFAMPRTFDKVGTNHFRELNFGSSGGAADQRYFQARYRLQPSEALIGRWRVPERFAYWGISLFNDAYQVLDWGNRQVNLNHALAKVGTDRVLHFVICHQDPGVANWLDPVGHEIGIVMTRTKGCAELEAPALKVVDSADVLAHLPREVALTTEATRAQDLSVRRRHFQLREGC